MKTSEYQIKNIHEIENDFTQNQIQEIIEEVFEDIYDKLYKITEIVSFKIKIKKLRITDSTVSVTHSIKINYVPMKEIEIIPMLHASLSTTKGFRSLDS